MHPKPESVRWTSNLPEDLRNWSHVGDDGTICGFTATDLTAASRCAVKKSFDHSEDGRVDDSRSLPIPRSSFRPNIHE